MKLTLPGVGLAVPAQPADFQAKAESDTRIQLSWLLPPQERIIKYELVYWAAEDEGQEKWRHHPRQPPSLEREALR